MYMPDFDGTGPLKRGRLIGRGRGPCKKNTDGSGQPEQDPDSPVQKKLMKNNLPMETVKPCQNHSSA